MGKFTWTPWKELPRPRLTKGTPSAAWGIAGYKPNLWSVVHVHQSGCRFNALTTCRQVGKTEALSWELFDALTAAPHPQDQKADSPPYVGLISFDFDHAKEPVNRLLVVIEKVLGPLAESIQMNVNEHWLKLKSNGAMLQWFSSENVLSVQGKTFSKVFLDESQNIPDTLWENMRPALDVRMAQVFAFGTPDPVPTSSWFEGLYLKGQDPEAENYHSFTITAFENRWINRDTFIDAYENMSEANFRMKYLGQWVDSEGQVFRNVDANFTGTYAGMKYDPKHTYGMGLDLAKHYDYTVGYVMDLLDKRIVARFRFNGMDYGKVEDLLIKWNRDWHLQWIHMDESAGFEAAGDLFRKRHLPVIGNRASTASKAKLIERLTSELEKQKLILPVEDKQLRAELKAFRKQVMSTGNVKYTAPVNFNDDCVIALALVTQMAGRSGKIGVGTWAQW